MRIHRVSALVATVLLTVVPAVAGQGNGNLQIHFMDVGQGDGALLISPLGETVLFDNGVKGQCSKPVDYLGLVPDLEEIDYHIASHYHADHIGCAEDVLRTFPLRGPAYDRGWDYDSEAYRDYVDAVGSWRREAERDLVVTLDEGTAHRVPWHATPPSEIVSAIGAGGMKSALKPIGVSERPNT